MFQGKTRLDQEIALARDSWREARLRFVTGREPFASVLIALVKLQTLRRRESALRRELKINQDRLLRILGEQMDLVK